MGSLERMCVLLAAMAAVAGCGAEFVKPAGHNELLSHDDVIGYAKPRYTSFRVSMGQSQWQDGSSGAVSVASFRIASNKTGWTSDQVAFELDMKAFCEAHGGHYWTAFNADSARVIPTLMRDARPIDLLRARANYPATLTCGRGAAGAYLFVGEVIYHDDGAGVVSLRTRLNQGARGEPLSFEGRPTVR